MASPLQWLFSLVDSVSGPAGAMSSALEKVEGALQTAGGAAEKLGGTFNKLTGSAGGFIKSTLAHASGELLAHGFEKAGELATRLVERVIDIGKEAVNAAAGAERVTIRFKTLLGAEGGEEALGFIDRIVHKTEFSKNQLEAAAGGLLSAGFKLEEFQTVLGGAADIANMLGGGADKLDIAISAFTRLKLKGELDKRSLLALSLSPAIVFEKLAGLLGTTAEQAEKIAGEGKAGDAGLVAVLQAIAAKQGGAIGTGSDEASKTLQASINKLSNLPDTYFDALERGPGFVKLRSFLADLVEKFDPNSPIGSKIQSGIGAIFDGLVNVFERLATGDNLQKLTDGMVSLANSVARFLGPSNSMNVTLSDVIDTLKVVGSVAGAVKDVIVVTGEAFAAVAFGIYKGVEGLMNFGEFVGNLFGRITAGVAEFGQMLYDKFLEIGANIWHGIMDGLASGIGFVLDGISNMGDAMVAKLKDVLGIHSPSTVFEKMGENTGEGFARGVENSNARVDTAMERSFGSFESGNGSTGRASLGSPQVTISVPITVNGGGPETADEIKGKLETVLPSIIANAFEQLAVEQGVDR